MDVLSTLAPLPVVCGVQGRVSQCLILSGMSSCISVDNNSPIAVISSGVYQVLASAIFELLTRLKGMNASLQTNRRPRFGSISAGYYRLRNTLGAKCRSEFDEE